MTQSQLDQQVAKATGESVEFVRSMGFSPLIPPVPDNRPHLGGQQVKQLPPKRTATATQPLYHRKAA